MKTKFKCVESEILSSLKSKMFSKEKEKDDEFDLFYTGITLTTEVDDANFDLFGCWNSNCESDLKDFHMNSLHQPELIKIMTSYQQTIKSENNFRITFGDNIYYNKSDKKLIKEYINKKEKVQIDKLSLKNYDFEIVSSKDPSATTSEQVMIKPIQIAINLIDKGFNCLPKKPTFISLGNHDIEYKYILQYQIHKCFLEYNKEGDYVTFGDWILPNAFYAVKFIIKNKFDILFIYIDTNLFESDTYTYIKLDKKKAYRKKMLEWLTGILENPANVDCLKFIIGHEPIFHYTHIKDKSDKKDNECKKDKKDKKDKKAGKDKKTDGDEGEAEAEPDKAVSTNPNVKSKCYLVELYTLFKEQKISAYMCADEHNFQWLTDSKHNIHHLICGSSPGGGGGDVTNTFLEDQLCFSNKPILVPELEGPVTKKIVINAPTFMNMIIHDNLVQINVVSCAKLTVHNKILCKIPEMTDDTPDAEPDAGAESGAGADAEAEPTKEAVVPVKEEIDENQKGVTCKKANFDLHSIYEIVTIPKYNDYIAVYNCKNFKKSYLKKQCALTEPTA